MLILDSNPTFALLFDIHEVIYTDQKCPIKGQLECLETFWRQGTAQGKKQLRQAVSNTSMQLKKLPFFINLPINFQNFTFN